MDARDGLKLLHLLMLPFLGLAFLMMHPRHAEKSYHRNMRWMPCLLPGRWKEKEFFVAWTRRLSRVWSVVLLLTYGVLLLILLGQ
jgi:hypothetical protein